MGRSKQRYHSPLWYGFTGTHIELMEVVVFLNFGTGIAYHVTVRVREYELIDLLALPDEAGREGRSWIMLNQRGVIRRVPVFWAVSRFC